MPDTLEKHTVDFSYPRGGETFNIYDTVIFNWTSTYYRPIINFWPNPRNVFNDMPLGHAPAYTNGTYKYAYFDVFTKNIPDIPWPITIQVVMVERWFKYSWTGSNGPRFTLVSNTASAPSTYALLSTVSALSTPDPPPPLSLAPAQTYKLPDDGLLQGKQSTGPPPAPTGTALSQNPGGSSGLSEGAAIGIGVGVGVGFLVVLVFSVTLILYILRRRRRPNELDELGNEKTLLEQRQQSDTSIPSAQDSTTTPQQCVELHGAEIGLTGELPYNNFIREAPDSSCSGTLANPCELPSDYTFVSEVSDDSSRQTAARSLQVSPPQRAFIRDAVDSPDMDSVVSPTETLPPNTFTHGAVSNADIETVVSPTETSPENTLVRAASGSSLDVFVISPAEPSMDYRAFQDLRR